MSDRRRDSSRETKDRNRKFEFEEYRERGRHRDRDRDRDRESESYCREEDDLRWKRDVRERSLSSNRKRRIRNSDYTAHSIHSTHNNYNNRNEEASRHQTLGLGEKGTKYGTEPNAQYSRYTMATTRKYDPPTTESLHAKKLAALDHEQFLIARKSKRAARESPGHQLWPKTPPRAAGIKTSTGMVRRASFVDASPPGKPAILRFMGSNGSLGLALGPVAQPLNSNATAQARPAHLVLIDTPLIWQLQQQAGCQRLCCRGLG